MGRHLVLFLLCICKAVTSRSQDQQNIWALLVAGSEGWDNYRHQADICHAYQILHGNGIPDRNIVVMMVDDIAHNMKNPTPGVVINHPGGNDVYKGVIKDYTGKDVTPVNFLHVLMGNKSAMNGIGSGKVIESGPNDVVFVNFVDHGGPGVLWFPEAKPLFADQLLNVIELMTEQSKFSKMVWYVEACNAGSMFNNLLPEDTNVIVLTAADPNESSYCAYYDNTMETYLGDLFSVLWMNDTERESLPTASLHHQFQKVRTATTMSHVEEYGDLDIGVTKLKDFLGYRRSLTQAVPPPYPVDTANNLELPLVILEKRKNAATDPEKKRMLELEMQTLTKKRQMVDSLFMEITARAADNSPSRKIELWTSHYALSRETFPCYRSLYRTFINNCYNSTENEFVRDHMQKLVNMCSSYWLSQNRAEKVIVSTCNGLLRSN